MREEPSISHVKLRAFLHEHYDLDPVSLVFLPVGDTHSAIYHVETSRRATFLLKLRTSIDPACLRIARFLHDQDLNAVIAPVATNTGTLSAHFESWTAVILPYVEGETGWGTIRPHHWREAGRIFQRIHTLALQHFDIRGITHEAFDPSIYAVAVEALEAQLAAPGEVGTPLQLLQTAWRLHRTTIHALLASLEQLATTLKPQTLPLVVCHADLHPGNLLRDPSGRVFVIDWDDVMLAPRERDFIFTGEPADQTHDASSFFEGYGNVTVDWHAITYYRYERVVQDLIVYAQDIFRDDLSDQTKANSLRSFRECLVGRNFQAAEVAATHVSPELTVSGAGRGDIR